MIARGVITEATAIPWLQCCIVQARTRNTAILDRRLAIFSLESVDCAFQNYLNSIFLGGVFIEFIFHLNVLILVFTNYLSVKGRDSVRKR